MTEPRKKRDKPNPGTAQTLALCCSDTASSSARRGCGACLQPCARAGRLALGRSAAIFPCGDNRAAKRVMLSSHEKQIWRALGEVLGGLGCVAEMADRRMSTLGAWRSGARRPSVDVIDRWIAAVGGLPQEAAGRARLLMELQRWRADAAARMAAGHAKTRQAFLQRFGHLPDDPAWQRRKIRDGDAVTPVLPGRSGIPRSRVRRDF